jgi:Putative Actinobacterial Holin-X, holin superfamily III
MLRDDDAVKPDLKNLLSQLATDSRDFARAEVAWVKAEAGSRASIAIPGLIFAVAAIALLFALIIAGLLGGMFALAPLIGLGWAVLAVISTGALIAFVLAKIGSAKLARAFSVEKDR